MSLLFDYYRTVFDYIGQLLSTGHWLALIVGLIGLLLGIFLFFVVLGIISEKLFSPFGSAEGGKGHLFLLPIVIVAILASIALPQFIQYRSRAEITAAAAALTSAQQGVIAYQLETLQVPTSFDQMGFTPPATGDYSLTLGDGGMLILNFNAPADLAGKTIQLSYNPQGSPDWTCVTDVDPALLPDELKAMCAPAGGPPPDQQAPVPDQQLPPAVEQPATAPADQTPSPSDVTASLPAVDQTPPPLEQPAPKPKRHKRSTDQPPPDEPPPNGDHPPPA